MTTAATSTTQPRIIRAIGLLGIAAGLLLVVAGVSAWVMVSSQLAAEEITVADDAAFLAGAPVTGPFTAYAQADIINHHALESSGGQTYAQLDREDPARASVMNASFLRASLFTSVVAFGVSALVVGLGFLLALFGWTIRTLAPRGATRPTPSL